MSEASPLKKSEEGAANSESRFAGIRKEKLTTGSHNERAKLKLVITIFFFF